MYQEVSKTTYPPKNLPIMIWDGQCGFCKYWITVWKCKTGNNINYQTYQQAASRYPDISLQSFKKAVRLIEQTGMVYGGPYAAYRSMLYFPKPVKIWAHLYQSNVIFRSCSDWSYFIVTHHRSFMLTLTIMMFGSNPYDRRNYWLWYLGIFIIALLLLWI